MEDSLENQTPAEVAAMAAMYQKLLSNPATRELTLRASKKIDPSLSIPEVDLRDMANGAFAARDEKIASLEQQIRERDAKDRVAQARAGLAKQGMSDDDVAAIEKLMVDEQIPSYETAAKYYRAQKQIATPTPTAMQRATSFELPKSPLDAMKNGKAGLKNWARSEASAALDDLRAGRITIQ